MCLDGLRAHAKIERDHLVSLTGEDPLTGIVPESTVTILPLRLFNGSHRGRHPRTV
jgi:hypothetical protein